MHLMLVGLHVVACWALLTGYLLAVRRHNLAVAENRAVGSVLLLARLGKAAGWTLLFTGIALGVAGPPSGTRFGQMLGWMLAPELAAWTMFLLLSPWACAPVAPPADAELQRRRLIFTALQVVLMGTVWGFLLATIYRESILPWIGGAAASWIAIYAMSRTLPRMGKQFPLDESLPLACEIGHLRQGFHVTRPLMVVPFTGDREPSAAELNGLLTHWLNSFRIDKPTLPLAVLQHAEPDATTAVLAGLMARQRPWKLPPFWFAGPMRFARFLPMGLGFLYFFGIALMLATGMRNNWIVAATIFWILPPLLLWVGLVLTLRLIWRRSDAKVEAQAFEAWQSAAPESGRTAAQFLAARCEFARVMYPDLEPEKLVASMLQQPAMAAFAKDHGIGAEDVLAARRR